MNVDLPLDNMSTEEKLLLMESLWDDLCAMEENVPSPEWHKETLDRREENIDNETSEFINWDEAKENIRNAIN